MSDELLKKLPEVAAILLSPLLAWIVTILYQNRAEKRKAKRDLFMVLMAKRHSSPPPVEFIDALNKIDVVFQNNKRVRAAWKEYLDSLHEKSHRFSSSNSFLLDLLSEVANVCGYKNLKQTEIDRFYNPKYLGNQLRNQELFWQEYLRVLDYSKSLAEGFSEEEMKRRNQNNEGDNQDNQ